MRKISWQETYDKGYAKKMAELARRDKMSGCASTRHMKPAARHVQAHLSGIAEVAERGIRMGKLRAQRYVRYDIETGTFRDMKGPR